MLNCISHSIVKFIICEHYLLKVADEFSDIWLLDIFWPCYYAFRELLVVGGVSVKEQVDALYKGVSLCLYFRL